MIQLKNLLFEDRTSEIGRYAAENFYHGEIFYEFDTEDPSEIPAIYRGVKKDFDFGWIEPAKYSRKSRNTRNFYTLVMDNSSEWSQYPDRSESIICTTSKGKASNYGRVYRVFPRPKSKLGITREDDIWYSFDIVHRKLKFPQMHDFNEFLNDLYKVYVDEDGELPGTWPEFKKELNKISQDERFLKGDVPSSDILSITQRQNFERFYKYFQNGNFSTLFSMLGDMLRPEKNDFKLKTFSNGLNLPINAEVWTDGPSLMVREDKVEELIS